MTRFHPSFDAFVAPARRRPQLWRLALGTVLALAIYLAWVFGTFALLRLVLGNGETWSWAGEVADANTPFGTLVLLSTFIGMALGPLIAARVVHGRAIGSVFGHAPKVLRHFVTAA